MCSTPTNRDSLTSVLRATKTAIIHCCAETGYGQVRMVIALYAPDVVAVRLRFGCDRLFKIPRSEFSSAPLLPLNRQLGRSLSGLVARIEDALRWCAEEGFGEVVIDITPSRKGTLQAVITRTSTSKFFFLTQEFDPVPLPA